MSRAILALTIASTACGASASPAPPAPRAAGTHAATGAVAIAADPIDPRAFKICDSWKTLVTRCPDLDYLETPYEECARTYTAALGDPHHEHVAGDVTRCLHDPGACSEILECLNRALEGIYPVTSYALDPDCTSHAPGKVDPHPRLGKRVDLDQLRAPRGKPVLVTFTATWEASSRLELPKLAKLAKLGGVEVIAVMSDTPGDRAALDGVPVPRLLIDSPQGDQTLGPITQAWGIQVVPQSFLIDATGVVRYHFTMTHDWASPGAVACVRSVAKWEHGGDSGR